MTADITDAWQEVMDPQNERGELVTAHFAVTDQPVDEINPWAREKYRPWRDLIGATVDDGIATRYLTRFDLTRLGIDCLPLDGWVE